MFIYKTPFIEFFFQTSFSMLLFLSFDILTHVYHIVRLCVRELHFELIENCTLMDGITMMKAK